MANGGKCLFTIELKDPKIRLGRDEFTKSCLAFERNETGEAVVSARRAIEFSLKEKIGLEATGDFLYGILKRAYSQNGVQLPPGHEVYHPLSAKHHGRTELQKVQQLFDLLSEFILELELMPISPEVKEKIKESAIRLRAEESSKKPN